MDICGIWTCLVSFFSVCFIFQFKKYQAVYNLHTKHYTVNILPIIEKNIFEQLCENIKSSILTYLLFLTRFYAAGINLNHSQEDKNQGCHQEPDHLVLWFASCLSGGGLPNTQQFFWSLFTHILI